jgi:hypothetical protein
MPKKKAGPEVVRYHFEDGETADVQLHTVLDALLSQLMRLKDATGNRRPYDDLVNKLSVAQRLADRKAVADERLAKGRARAKQTLKSKGRTTEQRVLDRYRYHRHKLRKPESIVAELIARDIGRSIGTVKNYLRRLRRNRLI